MKIVVVGPGGVGGYVDGRPAAGAVHVDVPAGLGPGAWRNRG